MKALLISIFSLMFLLSCSECDEGFTATKIESTTISKGQYFNTNYFAPQHGIVIYNQDEWNQFKALAWQVEEYPAETEVDFDQYIVIAAIDNVHQAGGYDIQVVSVTEYSSNVVAKIAYTQTANFSTPITRPYHFVKILRPAKSVILKDAVF